MARIVIHSIKAGSYNTIITNKTLLMVMEV